MPVATILAIGAGLFSGCNDARNTLAGRASAPGLGSEETAMHARSNQVAPNAPFTVPAPAPHLAMRAALLDVNGVPDCSPQDLNLFESRAQANGAHHSLQLTLQNLGAACRLSGFPSVSLLGIDGHVLGTIQVRRVSADTLSATLTDAAATSEDIATSPSPLVLLPAKGGAAFQLGWVSGPTCLEASRIVIGAPSTILDAAHAVVIPRPLSVCNNQVLITAIGPA